LVGLQNGQVKVGWKLFIPGNISEDENNGSAQGSKDMKEFKKNCLQYKNINK
jgi:hypothetical protein